MKKRMEKLIIILTIVSVGLFLTAKSVKAVTAELDIGPNYGGSFADGLYTLSIYGSITDAYYEGTQDTDLLALSPTVTIPTIKFDPDSDLNADPDIVEYDITDIIGPFSVTNLFSAVMSADSLRVDTSDPDFAYINKDLLEDNLTGIVWDAAAAGLIFDNMGSLSPEAGVSISLQFSDIGFYIDNHLPIADGGEGKIIISTETGSGGDAVPEPSTILLIGIGLLGLLGYGIRGSTGNKQ